MDLVSFFLGCISTLSLGIVWLIVHPWFRIVLSGGRASVSYVLGMRLRGTNLGIVIDAYLSLLHSGKTVTLREVELQYIANRASISKTDDLIHAIKETPACSHTAIWLDADNLAWLLKFLTSNSDRASARTSAARATSSKNRERIVELLREAEAKFDDSLRASTNS